MRRISRGLVLLFLCSCMALGPSLARAVPEAVLQAEAVESAPTRLEGTIVIPLRSSDGDGTPGSAGSQVEPFALRVLPEGFALVDFPDRTIYGFPVPLAPRSGGGLAFSIGSGAGAIRFTEDPVAGPSAGASDMPAGASDMPAGAPDMPAGAPDTPAEPLAAGSAEGGIDGRTAVNNYVHNDVHNIWQIEGRVEQGTVVGRFVLAPAPLGAGHGIPLEVAVPGGVLRGSLVLPAERAASGSPADASAAAVSSALPLVVLVSGPGSTDRDGNNYQVPGRNDTLLQLAQGLAEAGVASFRFDKRGSGESLALAPDESGLRFDDYVSDLRAVLAALSAAGRFGSMVVAGQGEGALVAAAALDPLPALRGGVTTPSLILLAASGTSALETFSGAIESAPPEFLEEGRAILRRLLEGGAWPDPSPYYEDFFRPSFQAYLASWLRYDLGEILPRLAVPLLLVQGDRDIQVDLENFLSLARLRPADPAVVIQGMNHVLKEVPAEVDANLAAFSDPGFPIAPDLVATLAAFARGEALPPMAARVDGGVLPAGASPRSAQDVAGPPTPEPSGATGP